MQKTLVTRVSLVLTIIIAGIAFLLREQVYVNSGNGQHIVYCRGLGMSHDNNLFGYYKTRVVSVFYDGEVREGRYLPANKVDFTIKCDGRLLLKGVSRVVDDVVRLPEIDVGNGGYLFESESFDPDGKSSGFVINGSGTLEIHTCDGNRIRQFYKNHVCYRYDIFRNGEWETLSSHAAQGGPG